MMGIAAKWMSSGFNRVITSNEFDTVSSMGVLMGFSDI
jgi:hypothetical protein